MAGRRHRRVLARRPTHPRIGPTPGSTSMPAVTAELAAYCASLDFATLPPEVQERTRFLVLDLVGNIVRGRHDAESTPALLAAFLDGALAHSLDFDDTHAAGTLHPGAPVIPAALAAAEMVGASGHTVLSA